MTHAKKLKKAIRARARKTGESYTAARRQVLQARAPRTRRAGAVAATAPPPPDRAAAPARQRRTTGERAVKEKTGHGFEHWFAVLDALGTPRKGHTDRAAHLHHVHGVPDWHCQMIAVEYERARGLRLPNQSCAGDFQVSVSKTVPASVEEVARTLSDPRRRRQWLRGVDPGLARAMDAALSGPQARKVDVKRADYARLRYPWDGSTIEIYINGKPNGKTSVAASNTRLAGPADVDHRRAVWAQALDQLRERLTG
jgi:hypothetical protein